MFWASVAALTVVVLAVVLFPLFRRREPAPTRAARDASVYRAQLAEIDEDMAQGLLTPEEAENARTEVERRILALATVDEPAYPGFGVWARRALIVVIVLLLPAGTVAVYAKLGAPGYPDRPLAQRTDELRQMAETKRFEEMVEGLAAKMEKNPDDVKGWAMLGRSYMVLGRRSESAKAYARAYDLSPEDPAIASAYGEALVHAGDGLVPDLARSLFEQTLERNPDNVTAQFYLGLAYAQTNNELPRALEIWTKLEKNSPPDAPWLATLKRHIRLLENKLKERGITVDPKAPTGDTQG